MKGSCYLGVSLIVDKRNAKHVYEILRTLKNIGVNSVKISPCLVNDSAADNNRYHKLFFALVKKQVERANKKLAGKDFEIFNAYIELDEKFKKQYTWCPYLQILPVIGADLNVYACPDKAYNLKNGKIGTINNMRFKDFWYSNKNNFFKINPSKQCNHHCETNQKNKLVLEYLNASKEHLEFV
jgi:MoaA/NifB/PqqE/SkfB family radical SAM enzyme